MSELLQGIESHWLMAGAMLIAFGLTYIVTLRLKDRLPTDRGKAFAHDGAKSKGKPQGAGIFFIMVFAVVSLIFVPFNVENVGLVIVVIASMLTGFLDDRALKPWSSGKKGLWDVLVSLAGAAILVLNNPSTITLILWNTTWMMPPLLYGGLAAFLIFLSINVTNCSDGVDGLSGTLSIISMVALLVVAPAALSGGVDWMVLIMVSCLMGYLWFNAGPSVLLMGDGGSRPMGLMIAIVALKSQSPLLYIPLAAVLLFNGGLGLVKIICIRLFKWNPFKNTIMPLHDEMRKKRGWSNTQTVTRFAIIQLVIAAVTILVLR